jgi:hypothetical protein
MNEQTKSRRRFVVISAGIAVVATLAGWLGFRARKKETVKLLTRDGRLVEIDKSMLRSTGKKIKEEELHTWVENKTAPPKTN